MDEQPVLEPDVHEVLQEEPDVPMTAIPVKVECVDGPVRVQVLPDKGGATGTRTVTTTQAVRVLVADARRKSAVLMATDNNFRVAFSQAACQAPSAMALWPKLVPLTVPATVEVWVQAEGGSTSLSYQTSLWAQ
jgi:hypothetical protein